MLPELSVDAVHARLIESSVTAVIRTFVGTVGGVPSIGVRLRGAEAAGTATARTASAAHALTASQRIFIGDPPPGDAERCRCRYTHRLPRRFSRARVKQWLTSAERLGI